jgi:hypothetical protein
MRVREEPPRLAEWPRGSSLPYTSEYASCVKFSIAPQHVVVSEGYEHGYPHFCSSKMKRKCVFSTPFIHDQVDPRVDEAWREAYRVKAPFAKLRQMWKTQHCVQVDPYNTGCPYSTEDCAMSFLVAVERTVGFHPERPTGYFRAVAHSMGLDRADNKPLARDTLRRTDVRKEGNTRGLEGRSETGRSSDRAGTGAPGVHEAGDQGVVDDASGLRRTDHQPVRIGELLGSLNLGPRSREERDGDRKEEGNKR